MSHKGRSDNLAILAKGALNFLSSDRKTSILFHQCGVFLSGIRKKFVFCEYSAMRVVVDRATLEVEAEI